MSQSPTQENGTPARPVERTAEYRGRDLHAEGAWPPGPTSRYGGVVFDSAGEVLLREPTRQFDGFAWTFPKGKWRAGEHPVDTALREVLEETGCRPAVVGHVPGVFTGGHTNSHNYFYVMHGATGELDESARDRETSVVRWVGIDEARSLIGMSTNSGGRDRDLATLGAAVEAWTALT